MRIPRGAGCASADSFLSRLQLCTAFADRCSAHARGGDANDDIDSFLNLDHAHSPPFFPPCPTSPAPRPQIAIRFNTPKYRLVVRFTSKDIVCQVVSSTLAGDIVLVSAYAHELPRYGLKVGLTNYAAAYAVGLLVARRALTKLGLADAYAGLEEASGEDYTVEPADGAPRPFAVLLDTGLKRTSTGSRVFGALKGALDGGLDVPHGEKRFVGYDADSKVRFFSACVCVCVKGALISLFVFAAANGQPTTNGYSKCSPSFVSLSLSFQTQNQNQTNQNHQKLDAEVLEKYILGGHVGEFMEELKEEDPEKYQVQFSRFVRAGVDSDDLEDLYKKVHAAIRADPAPQKKERSKPADAGKRWKTPKQGYEARKAALKAKLAEVTA